MHRERLVDPTFIRAPAPTQLETTFSARQLSDAAESVTSGVSSKLAALDAADRNAFQAGVDRVPVASTEHSGPHLLTTNAAREIEKAGRAFLESATSASERLNIPTTSRAMAFDSAGAFMPKRAIPVLCPFDRSNWPSCDASSPYRTFDGSCNNLANPLWGRSQTPFERFERPDYDDGITSPRTRSTFGGTLPNARLISREFHTNIQRHLPDLNHMTMEYGQFISHDTQFNALSTGYQGSRLDCCARPNRHNCFPIQIPPGDPFFPANRTCMNMVRALPTPNLDCRIGVRQQLNQNTHFIDGSHVYGSDKQTADSLRTFSDGLLQTSGGDLLPSATGSNAGCISSSTARPCFRAGDVRVNQQPGLMSLQTIWMREHNRMARRLAQINPSWDDEMLYQEARRIVVALMQHIAYNEYLPEILGSSTMSKYDLNPKTSGYFTGYDKREKPMIRNGFSTAAFRMGHSMIYHRMPTHSGFSVTSNQLLKDVFLKPDLIYTRGVGEVARGLTRSPSESVDKHVTEQVTRHLFERQAGFGGDLAAINIQRGRDHGIPNYQIWRDHCGLPGQYSHAPDVKQQLQTIYSSPFDMDLFTAGVSEIQIPDAKVGPTFACIIGKQFSALKRGDRFYYENEGPTAFSQDQLREIRKITLAKIICENSDVDQIQRYALKNIGPGNPLVGCRYIRDIDLAPWRAPGCTPVHGGWSSWQRTPCFGSWRIRYRLCNNPRPNSCGRPCSQPYQIRLEFCGFRFNPIRDIFNGREPLQAADSRSTAASSSDVSDVTRQVESQLSRIMGSGNTDVNPAMIEKALTLVNRDAALPSPVRSPAVRNPIEPPNTRRQDFRQMV